MMINIIDSLLKKNSKFIIYCLIGILCVFIEMIIFYIFLNKFNLNIFFINTFAIITTSLVSFFMNAFLNFKVSEFLYIRYIKFFIIILLGMFLSNFLLAFFLYFFSPIISKSLTLPFIAIFQFTLNKVWTFKKNSLKSLKI